MKSEPSEVSIDDLAARPGQTVPWDGVRNYQARNFMRNQMQPGDLVFFYHSSCPEPGIGLLIRMKHSSTRPANISTQNRRARIRAGSMSKSGFFVKPGCFPLGSCAAILNWPVCVSCRKVTGCPLLPSIHRNGNSSKQSCSRDAMHLPVPDIFMLVHQDS